MARDRQLAMDCRRDDNSRRRDALHCLCSSANFTRSCGNRRRDDAIDRVVLHPVWGMLLLAATLFLMFQAVFSWAQVPMDAINGGVDGIGQWVSAHMAQGPLRSLLVDGIIAGVGGVLVFLPQILILFFFILALEDSGYLPRAA